jgi:hypothetical protein
MKKTPKGVFFLGAKLKTEIEKLKLRLNTYQHSSSTVAQ